MLAASVGIDTSVEADIGAVVVGDDGTRGVFEELGLQGRVFRVGPLRIALVPQGFEAVRGVRRGATPAFWGRIFTHWTAAPPPSRGRQSSAYARYASLLL